MRVDMEETKVRDLLFSIFYININCKFTEMVSSKCLSVFFKNITVY